MFREKLTNFKQARGYLYIRESIYKRDRRTLKRKPSKLCDGSATKERGKYSKKIDIYCGKIHEIDLAKLDIFKYYVENILNKDYLDVKLNSRFAELIDLYVDYLIYVYGLDKEIFLNGQKKVYAVNNGYFSRETISWLKRFNINGNYDNSKEIERFTYRCEDCGIDDDEIINALYLKLVPDVEKEDLLEDIESIQIKTLKQKDFKSFIKNNRN